MLRSGAQGRPRQHTGRTGGGVDVEAVDEAPAVLQELSREQLSGPLHPDLEGTVRTNFDLGDYETACFAAMKAVEVAVRDAAGLDNSLVGVKLMREAFQPHENGKAGGALADAKAEGGEQAATANLFAGAWAPTRTLPATEPSTSTTRSRRQRSSSSPTCCCVIRTGQAPPDRVNDVDPHAMPGRTGHHPAGGSGTLQGLLTALIRPLAGPCCLLP